MAQVKLSRAAQDALVNAAPRQGALVRGEAEVTRVLLDAGLIAPRGGLTRRGTIERERVVTERLEAAFG